MPIETNSENNNTLGNQIDRTMVKNMVVAYRNGESNKDRLNFAYFSARQLLELYRDNGIISSAAFNACESPDLDIKGVKIYLGRHVNPADCPLENGVPNSSYLGHDTVIICNTILENGDWIDLLSDGPYSSSIAGNGLDRNGTCPPICNYEGGNKLTDIYTS